MEHINQDPPAASTRATVESFRPQGEPPAHTVEREAGSRYAQVLIEGLAEVEMLDAFRAGDGLCLAHLPLCLYRVRSEEQFGLLTQPSHESWSRLLANLDEMIRGHDYRFSHEGLEGVGDAWIRAVVHLAGGEGTKPRRRS